MSPRREYAGGAAPTTLASGINATDTSLTLTSGTNWPDGPNPSFAVIRTSAAEEKITFTGRSTNTLTGVTRGQDGTSAQVWDAGATVEHVWTATDAEDSNAHIFDTTRDDHTQLMKADGTRHDLTARHTVGTVVPSATPAIVLGTAAAAGAAGTTIRSDATIAAFDTTVPVIDGTAAAGSVARAARRDHVHPGATLGYAEVTADQLNVGGSVDLTGLSVAVTVAAGHRIKITGFVHLRSDVAQDAIVLRIMEGGTTLTSASIHSAVAGQSDVCQAVTIETPSTGAHTYKLQTQRESGTGTVDLAASASRVAFILVEDIGV